VSLIFVKSDNNYIEQLKKALPDYTIVEMPEMTRYMQMKNAMRGSILISDEPSDKYSPMFAGTSVKTAGEVESSFLWSSSRSSFYNEKIPGTLLTRVYAEPNNIIIGDPDGVDPRKYIDIFPDNWWGACAYLTEYEPKKLFTILEMYLYYTKPVAVTDAAVENLRRTGLDFVDAREYTLDRDGGLLFREHTRRSEAFEFLLEEKTIEP